MTLDKLHKEVLEWCAEDDVGFWNILRIIKRNNPDEKMITKALFSTAIEIVEDLLSDGLIEAGSPNGSTFSPIASSVSETIEYIKKELDGIEGMPGLGDVCWFRATSLGEKIASDSKLM